MFLALKFLVFFYRDVSFFVFPPFASSFFPFSYQGERKWKKNEMRVYIKWLSKKKRKKREQ